MEGREGSRCPGQGRSHQTFQTNSCPCPLLSLILLPFLKMLSFFMQAFRLIQTKSVFICRQRAHFIPEQYGIFIAVIGHVFSSSDTGKTKAY